MSYDKKILDQNHPIYQKVKKVFDLMKELDITFWIDKHDELRFRENSNNSHHDDYYVSDFIHNGCCFPTEELEIYENVWEEEEEELEYYVPTRMEVLAFESKNDLIKALINGYHEWENQTVYEIINSFSNSDYFEKFSFILDQITLDGISLKNFPKEFQHQKINEFKIGVIGINI